MVDIVERKKILRKECTRIRKSIFDPLAGEKAADIFLKSIVDRASRVVALYMPISSELDTLPLYKALNSEAISCALPVVVENASPLIFRRWTPDTVFVDGEFGIKVPDITSEEVVPDVVIAPMLAFDRGGYRLGYGGGFYDRTLQKLRETKGCLAVGYAFEGQYVEKLAIDEYDQPLDWVVTERQARKFS